MRRLLTALALASLVGVFPGAPLRADCICDKVAMYPVGGNLWMHYAIVYNDNCQGGYPTGHITDYSTGEICYTSPLCGQCSALGDPQPFGDLHFGKDEALPTYAELTMSGKFQDKLEAIAGSLIGGVSEYDDWYFNEVGVVELTRPSDGSKFYALLFRMTKKVGVGGSTPQGIVGLQIAPPSATPLDITYQCNAVAEGKTADLPIPGLLEVGLKATGEVAFIRVQDSVANRNAKFEPCVRGNNNELVPPGIDPVAPAGGCQAACNTYCDDSYRRCTPWRRHCRPFRRGCR